MIEVFGMKIPVIFTDGEDGFIVAKCPVLPGCVSQGKTIDEAESNIIDAIQGVISVRREMGLPDIETMTEVEVAL
jgi:predicted RNase H-like HicB family nuclease